MPKQEGVKPSRAPVAARKCRLCGGPAGPNDECKACEAEVSAYIENLVAQLDGQPPLAEAAGRLEAIAQLPSPPAPRIADDAPAEPEELPAPAAAGPQVFEAEAEAIELPDELVVAEEIHPAPSKPPPVPPEPVRSNRPPRRPRGRRLAVAAVALAALATAGSLAVSQGDSGTTAPAPAPEADVPAEDSPPTAPEAPKPDPIEKWVGDARVIYDDGTTDELSVVMKIGPLSPGEEVGTAKMTQNGTECGGTLTSLGRVDRVFRFSYREENTEQCVASGRITLTPAGKGRLAYEEKTEISVNRGILTRG